MRILPKTQPRPRRRGFTITELMISVALVLILTLAIGLIFRTTTESIGKSQATSEVTRNLDAITGALKIDFTGTDSIDNDAFTDAGGILPNSEQVAIVISSFYVPTWANEAQADADDEDYRAILEEPNEGVALNAWMSAVGTYDRDGSGTDDATVEALLYGTRSFRTDLLTFGARGQFASQTSTRDQGFSLPYETSKAMMVWGHLKVFNNNYGLVNRLGGYGLPGEPLVANGISNVNNVFADQFVLGRFALLFGEPNASSTGAANDYIQASDGSSVPFVRRIWTTPEDTSTSDVLPFGSAALVSRYYSTESTIDLIQPDDPSPNDPPEDSNMVNRVRLNWGRTDVLGSTAAELRDRLAFVGQETPSAAYPTYSRAAFSRTTADGTGDPYDRKPAAADARLGGGTINNQSWWEVWFTSNDDRVWINPFGQQPFDAATMGQRFHYVAPAARQFIVEYAGDYLEQAADGTIADVNGNGTVIEPDGQIDFVVDVAGRRSPRFYGFPRDADGDRDIELYDSSDPSTPVLGRYRSPDVVPLKDMVGISGGAESVANNATAALPFPHEKLVPIVDRTLVYTTATIAAYTGRYVCAWGPDELDGNFSNDAYAPASTNFGFPLGPKLIRIVVEASDTDGKLETPLSTEVVFRVPD